MKCLMPERAALKQATKIVHVLAARAVLEQWNIWRC